MVPHLAQLENAYDPSRPLDFDAYDLVRFALTTDEYWAEKALDWLSSGLPAGPVASELRALADDKRLPQRLRHRAFSIWKKSGQAHEGPPSMVPVPEKLVRKVFDTMREVRMGVYLASVLLRNGDIVEPVVVNARPNFIGIAVAPDLAYLLPVPFGTQDVADVSDASSWDRW